MLRRIPQKNTPSRAGSKLMRRGGGEFRIASTSKNPKLLICGRCVVQASKGTRGADSFGGKAIEKISGCMKSIYPIARRHGRLEQQGADHIVGGAEHAFGFTVLWWCIGARHVELHTIGEEEGPGRGVVKLPTIITLDLLDRAPKLSMDTREKMRDGGKSIRFEAQRKSPRIMGKIIKDNQIVFKPDR
jgi:hypothetical protein